MRQGLHGDILRPKDIAFSGISPGFIISNPACFPATIACFSVGLTTVTLAACLLIVCLLAELLRRAAEAPATAADIQGALFILIILAAFCNSIAVANAVFFGTPVRPEATAS